MLKESVDIYLTCVICKKQRRIRTNNLELYTEEVRKNFTCLFCKPSGRVRRVTEKKEGTMAEGAVVEINGAQLEEIKTKLRVPNRWKKEVGKRYEAGAKTLPMLLTELDSIVDTKTRIKSTDAALLQQQKDKIKAGVRKTLAAVLKVEVK